MAKGTRKIGENVGKRIRIAKLKYGLGHVRQKIRELYTQIGGEVCVLEAEGRKNVEIEKGQMKKLINEVRKCENQMEKIEEELAK